MKQPINVQEDFDTFCGLFHVFIVFPQIERSNSFNSIRGKVFKIIWFHCAGKTADIVLSHHLGYFSHVSVIKQQSFIEAFKNCQKTVNFPC